MTPSIFSKVALLLKRGKGFLVEFGSGFRVKGFNYIVIIIYNCLCIIITLKLCSLRRLSTLNFELSSHLRTLWLLLNTHNVIVCLFLYDTADDILLQ